MATVSELRTLFRSWTGRPGMSDSDVDFFLNSGQRLLDMRLPSRKSKAKYFAKVGKDAVGVKLQSCRYIYSVFAISSEGRTELEKVDSADMFEAYAGNVDAGTPSYYAPWTVRPFPDTLTAASLDDYLSGVDDYVIAENQSYVGLMFYPPADATYTFEIVGGFFTPDLSDSFTETYWSTYFPSLVVQAAMVEYEYSLRNRSAATEWLEVVEMKLADLVRDQVEEELADVDDIEA